MSDPDVIADRERYAEVGREYRQLQDRPRPGGGVRDAERRPRGRARAARRGRGRGNARGGRRGAGADRGARRGDPPGDGRTRPERREERDRRDPRRDRRRRGGALRRRPLQDADPLRRAARLLHRRPLAVRLRGGRLQGGHLRSPRRGRLLGLQVRGRHPPRPAGAGDREPGAHPHLDRDDRGAARGRGGRRPGRPERPADRRLPLLRAGRPVGQHDRLGGADHPQTDRDRRLDAGREVPAAEPRQGDAGAAGAAARAAGRRTAGADRLRAQGAGRQRRAGREGPHLQLPPGPDHRPPDQAHLAQPRRRPGNGELDEFTNALSAEEKRRRLEDAAEG